MGFSDFAYEEFFAPNFKKIKTYVFPELIIEKDKNFISELFLSFVFFSQYDKVNRPVAYYIIRRIQQSIETYNEARIGFIELAEAGENRLKPYINSLNKLELLISLLYQIYNLYKPKEGEPKLFESNDGSSYQRLNRCYNQIKHIDNNPYELNQFTFLDVDRFSTSESYVTFIELHDFIQELVGMANRLLDIKD